MPRECFFLSQDVRDAIEAHVRDHGPSGLVEFVLSCSEETVSELDGFVSRDFHQKEIDRELEANDDAWEAAKNDDEIDKDKALRDARDEWFDEAIAALENLKGKSGQ